MARKRAPEWDYICLRCLCPCESVPGRHLGGGTNLKACSGPSVPILRSKYEADVKAAIAALRERKLSK